MIESGSKAYKKITLSLALGSFLVFCNLYLLQPMLPLLAKHFVVSETQINWVFAATTLTLAVSLVPWAVCSEIYGRRNVMLIGLYALPAIGLCMSLTDSLIMLVLFRALLGLALAAFASVAVAYMAEELSEKAFSLAIGGYIAANSLGGISGRIAGGMLADLLSWEAAVLIMATLTLLGAVCLQLLLPKQKNFKPQKGMLRFHNRALVKHLQNQKLWFAMLVGGLNFALFVNLYTVMGFRLVSAPHSLPIALASLIFLCYLAGTVSSKLSGSWLLRHGAVSGMLLGSIISMMGMWLAYIDQLPFMLAGLLLISFGAFFTHTLAYGWVSRKAVQGKATATALYLVHYYIGGSLGGFFLIYLWQHGGWAEVIAGGMMLYLLMFGLILKLKRTHQLDQIKTQPEAM
ncbi:MFS transporter [Vibrio sp. NTOU-M3]|uniref:MFS transporter n=1 Tax=Vibrio sp. NTOU-M3 TaxID=3234954 RepID=UPI00349F763A